MMAENLDMTIDDYEPMMLEYPFVREGMTIREYNEEKEYFSSHFDDYKNGNYRPLWMGGVVDDGKRKNNKL